MKVSVAGTGYVGLVSGVCLADLGHQVICVDVDRDKVAKINAGEPPIYEENLQELLNRNVGRNLTASTDLRNAVLQSELTLIAVGTPFNGDEIDLTYIREVARQIGEALAEKDSYHVVVVKSTVVPGTTDNTVLPILEKASGKKAGADFGVGMNPEFLKEGEAIRDFMNPDRIVFGGIDQKSIAALRELYGVFDNADTLEVNCCTAEMIKYTANSLLATLISFSNEIANLCAATGGVDVTDVMAGVHLDKRLSPILADGSRIKPTITTYIEAGCGFGGSCFPKDVKALVAYGKALGSPMPILDSVIKINDAQPYKMIELFDKHFASAGGLSAAVLGLSFKPGSDDMRESPAIPIIKALLEKGVKVKAYDPIARHEAEKVFKGDPIVYAESLNEAVADVDAILLVTRCPEFAALPAVLKSKSVQPVLIDGRRMIAADDVEHYYGIGRQ